MIGWLESGLKEEKGFTKSNLIIGIGCCDLDLDLTMVISLLE